ncbi:hypothetical protein [Solibacillus daqui]|uniref:hypothetical protein n=1 Tax=Solibacillus daqui TaxID=2912187 RepID=UPI002365701D|nr:hypothetical protein [Solibacillus daqui]
MIKKTVILIFITVVSLVVTGCNNEEPLKEEVIQNNWHENPLFKSGGYTMIGEEGHLGFLYDDNEESRFYPNKTQKYMWHLWGNEDELTGNFEVLGSHENSNEEIIIVPKVRISFLSPNNDANHHIPTNMTLFKSGMWKLDAYIGDRLFGSIYVKVHQK